MLPVTLNPRLGAIAKHDPFAGPALSAFVPVSESQSEVWLAAMMGVEANLSFNEGLNLKLLGALDVAALHGALQTIVNRHEALRGVISPDGRSMGILAELNLPLPLVDVSSEAHPAAALAAVEQVEMAKAFDLEAGPLLRTTLVKVAAEQHHLLLIAHHVVCDGWSAAVIMTELGALYSAAVDGASLELYVAPRYGDYSLIESRFLRSETGRSNEAYWLKKLENPPQVVDLPADRPRPVPRAYTASRIDHPFSAELVANLKRTAASQGSSLVTIMLAGFAALLNRLTGSEDLVIGLDSAGQSLHNQMKLVGHCVNKMPLRLKPERNARFSDFLKAARNEVLDAQDHQGITYGSLLSKLKLERDESRPVLIAVTFNIDVRDDDISHSGLKVSYDTMVRQADNQELFINVVDNGKSLLLEASYNTALFDADTVRRRIAEYESVLVAVSSDVHQTIASLPLLSSAEYERLSQGSRTATVPIPDIAIHRAIEEQVARTPDAIAVASESEQLSYAELNRRANQVASWLRANGAGADKSVAICMQRTPSALVAMLATLKAGAAYLPIDPEYPAERIAYMLADANPVALLSDLGSETPAMGAPERAALLAAGTRPHLNLIADWATVANLPDGNDAAVVPASSLAYVLYTSGSTGKPKGTLLEHAGPLNQYQYYIKALKIDAESRFLVFSSLAFDLTQRNLWAPLMAGGRVVFVESAQYDVEPILSALQAQAITHVCCTPSAFYPLVEQGHGARLATVQQLALGGEAIQLARLADWRSSANCKADLTNCYGPTEASANVAMFHLPLGGVASGTGLPIGKAIANAQLYVLDAGSELQPLGVAGELHIGGIQLARGYLNRPELTAERFIDHPKFGRLYRTGDLCRWRSDGELEYIGRVDSQVKLRGHRVELGEIEATLASHPDITGCAVGIIERTTGDQRLVAWIVTAPGLSLTPGELRAFLRADLPQYMIPQHVVEIEQLPLTASGKLDRRALPPPFASSSGPTAKTPPNSVTEKTIAAIWADVLGADNIGIEDRFFELGGHSLLAVQAAGRMQKAFGSKLPLRMVMMDPLGVLSKAYGDSSPAAAAKPMVAKPTPVKNPAVDAATLAVPKRESPTKKKGLFGSLFGD